MAIKTLLLSFIHGFKGDEETFYQFDQDLKQAISSSNPNLNVETRVYPKYETRGDLALTVEAFKEWLQTQTIELEKQNGNVSAIQEPSVAVILVSHSMGGFVAADTLFSVLDNRPVSQDPKVKLMFPLIQGVLAFDTPYNGLSRSMFAYGAFSQYQNISSAWNLLSTGTSFLTSAGARQAGTQIASNQASNAARNQLATQGAASNNQWTRWSALAARTGTYGAIMAGGVAAYIHRDSILESLRGINRESISQNLSKVNYANTKDAVTSINYTESISNGLTYVSRESIGEGFAWMAGHLKFVGALMKTTQLTTRLERLSEIEGVGIKCLYTSLGENGVWTGGYFVPKRTFCAIPSPTSTKDEKEKAKAEKMKELFIECPDTKAANEIVAHCGMFKKEKNDNYDNMLKLSVELVGQWLQTDPRRVKDEWKPTHHQLQRTMSESKVWDDDGKVLKPPGGDSDEGQLEAVLQSDEMPHGEDGGVDEEELKKAVGVPLPVDEDVVGEGQLGEKIEDAVAAVKSAEDQKPVAEEKAVDQKIADASFEGKKPDEEIGEAAAEEKESDEDKPPLMEYEKPLKVEDGEDKDYKPLIEEMGKASLDNAKRPQLEAKQESESQQQTETLTKQEPKEEPKEEATEEAKEEADSAPKNTWMGMIPSIPSVPSWSAKQQTTESTQEQRRDTATEPLSTEDTAAKKTWTGMIPSIPSVPSWSAKEKENAPKSEGDAKPEQKEESVAPKDVEPRKKWFGVV